MSTRKIVLLTLLTAVFILLSRPLFSELFAEYSMNPRIRWNRESIMQQAKTGNIDKEFQKFFDRDPERKVPDEKNIIVAPADGRVVSIEEKDGNFVILIRLSFYDVHVQRVPLSGKVLTVENKQGEFLPNRGERYLIDNFQVITNLETEIGKVQIRQISGLYAKRIKNYVKPGDKVVIGQRLGRILFGSTAVLTIPSRIKNIEVAENQQVYGGETVIARY
jgi:phosphatidylserine decarboxylase